MAKRKIIYDIKPIHRKQNEPVPQQNRTDPPVHKYPHEHQVHRWPIWIIASASLAALFFALSLFFSGATVHITPLREVIDLDETALIAYRDGGELSFELMVISQKGERTIPAQEKETLEEKARGVVRIFNNYSTAQQRLLINTRIESADGNIYFTDEPVTIPGRRTDSNGEVVPGSVDVTVTAQEAGEAYNSDLTDFTIVGFQGTAKQNGFFARSTTPLTGGFTGTVYVANEEDRTIGAEQLQEEQERTLLSKASAQIPESYILFDDALMYEHMDPVYNRSGEVPEVTVTQESTLSALLFKRSDLAAAIAKKMLSQYAGEPVTIPNLDDLDVTLVTALQPSPESVNRVELRISGTVHIVWDVDYDAVREALASTRSRAFEATLEAFPTIESARMKITPFWKNTFPEDPQDITIESGFAN